MPIRWALASRCPISAEHGQGMLDLRDAIVAALGEDRDFPEDARAYHRSALTDVDVADAGRRGRGEPAYDDTKPLRVAIVGRPNAGKSTLINTLRRRGAAPDRPGSRHHARFHLGRLGMARPHDQDVRHGRHAAQGARAGEAGETLSVADGLRAIRFAEVVVLCSIPPSPSKSRICRSPTSSSARAGRRDRLQQVGPDRRAAGSAGRPAREDGTGCCRRPAASAPSRYPGKTGRGSTEADAGRRSIRTRSGTAHLHGRLNRWLDETQGPPSAAGRLRSSAEAEIHDAGEGPPAGLHDLLHAPRCPAANPIRATWSTRCARLRHAGRADPHSISHRRQSLRVRARADRSTPARCGVAHIGPCRACD
jgi:hypothetical protein